MTGSAARPCPICGRPGDPRFGPFCSKRCADVDLGRWLTDAYAVPVGPEDETDGEPERRDREPDA